MAGPAGLTKYQVVSDGQGKFSVDVPPGFGYSVCAESPRASLLNCVWYLGESLVQVPPDAKGQEMVFTLHNGSLLRIRVNDPKRILPTLGTRNAPGAPIGEFSLWDSQGHYHPVPGTSSDEKGLNYEVLVPVGLDVRLTVRGYNVQVLNQGNTAAPAGANLSSQLSNLGQVIVYNISPLPNPTGVGRR
jgi:hypothetical protein